LDIERRRLCFYNGWWSGWRLFVLGHRIPDNHAPPTPSSVTCREPLIPKYYRPPQRRSQPH
jgi:hypothetical protein